MFKSLMQKALEIHRNLRGAMSIMSIIMILVAILVLYSVIGYVVSYNASVQAGNGSGLTKLFADFGEWFFVLIPIMAILGIGGGVMRRRRRR